MKYFKIIKIAILLVIILGGCKKGKTEIDKQKPEIDLTIQGAFPLNCDTLYFGETFYLRALFKDNAELGANKAFSIDIHNNFDHHSHSTEVNECDLSPKKEPINPFIFIQSYDITEGVKEYNANILINIPANNENGKNDEGDYHLFISLTDKEGWSTQKGLSIKIMHR